VSSKYRNIRVDGFHSKAEKRRHDFLMLRQAAGEVANIELQPAYPIVVNGVKVCTYSADFRYVDKTIVGPQGQAGCIVVEDVKSPITRKNPLYRLKKKLVEAVYPGVVIQEVA
jgi:hypothetical protein